ncbi:hypothetical protein [Adhaeribacter pallidiroseus]|uniref:Uncharacterized protein n=1 Tax=Adhaeribacter pallidiroseus TaxID=2072847 RepID=A0A369QD99_9BACT|nr:hypothetical protein [Adhaeribacter pallidiroseus]RDC62881.1 hypothetical protein AHMF7616_01480 [Adhaeribacter pallidiroseus]
MNNKYLALFLVFISLFYKSYSQVTGNSQTKNDDQSRTLLLTKIEGINEQINDKKADRKEIKNIADDINITLTSFDQIIKPDVDNNELSRLQTELNKTRKISKVEQIYYLFIANFRPLSARFTSISKQNNNLELQNLVSTISNRLGEYDPYRIINMGISLNDEVADSDIDELNISKINATYTRDNYLKLKSELKEQIQNIKSSLDKQIKTLDDEISALNNERFSLQDQIEKKAETDETIFKWGFPVFIIFILLIYLIPLLLFKYRNVQQSDSTSGDVTIYSAIYGAGLVTEIITVFLLTSTILLLGLTDKLNSEILGTLIGGISGFVLGRAVQKKSSTP